MLTPKRAENTTKMNAPCHVFDTLLRRQLLQNKLIISLLFVSKKTRGSNNWGQECRKMNLVGEGAKNKRGKVTFLFSLIQMALINSFVPLD